MARGTTTMFRRTTTAKQLQKLVTKYELIMNEIVEATKRFDPETTAGTEGRWIREKAFDLQGHLHALWAHVADEENETR